MRTSFKIQISKNFFFISLIILINLFCCYGIHKKDMIILDMSNLMQMNQELAVVNLSNSTIVNSAETNTSSVNPVPNLEDQNKENNQNETITTNQSLISNQTVNSSTGDNKEIKESMEKNNQKLEELEKTLKEQAKFFEDIKRLLTEVDNLSNQMNQTEHKNKEILSSVADLKQMYDQLDYKLSATSLQMDNKLNKINSKLVKQLENQLNIQVFNLQKEISECADEVEKLNKKIKILKSKLPNPDSICTMFNSCGSCTSNPACGWCSISQQCVEGNDKGPLDGSCTFYEFSSCGGPISCDNYKKCDDCIKDIACGWCNNPGTPTCINKDNADQGECQQDKFVHLWNSLNVCPHVDLDTTKAHLMQDLNNNLDQDFVKENPFDLDPEQKKKLIDDLKIYQEEKINKEVLLDKLFKALNHTEEQIKGMEQENINFNLVDFQDDKDKFYELSKSVFDMLKGYLTQFAKDNNNTDLQSNMTVNSNMTQRLEGNNETLTNQTESLMNLTSSNITEQYNNSTKQDNNSTIPSEIESNVTLSDNNSTEGIIPENENNSTNSDNNNTISNDTINEENPNNNSTESNENVDKENSNSTEVTEAVTENNNSTDLPEDEAEVATTETTDTETPPTTTETPPTTTETPPTPTENPPTPTETPPTATETPPTATTETPPTATETPTATTETPTATTETPTATTETPTATTETPPTATTEITPTPTPTETPTPTQTPTPTETPTPTSTTQNNPKDLLQISSDFGVDKNTFINSFLETKTDNKIKQKVNNNLRSPNYSKNIII